MHSRSRVQRYHEAKRKGRHQGHGKRRGCKDARMPSKVLWMRRQRVLRRLLKKYREDKKITKDIYHHFYLGSKGNLYKNKSVLIEAIHKMKQEKVREKVLIEQKEARRAKNAVRKEKRVQKKQELLTGKKEVKEPVAKEEKKVKTAKKDQASKQSDKPATAPKEKQAAPKKEAPKKEAPKKEAPKAEVKKEAPKAAPKKK